MRGRDAESYEPTVVTSPEEPDGSSCNYSVNSWGRSEKLQNVIPIYGEPLSKERGENGPCPCTLEPHLCRIATKRGMKTRRGIAERMPYLPAHPQITSHLWEVFRDPSPPVMYVPSRATAFCIASPIISVHPAASSLPQSLLALAASLRSIYSICRQVVRCCACHTYRPGTRPSLIDPEGTSVAGGTKHLSWSRVSGVPG